MLFFIKWQKWWRNHPEESLRHVYFHKWDKFRQSGH